MGGEEEGQDKGAWERGSRSVKASWLSRALRSTHVRNACYVRTGTHRTRYTLHVPHALHALRASHACLHACTPACLHACIPAFLHACMQTETLELMQQRKTQYSHTDGDLEE